MHPELVARLVVEDVGPKRPEDVASGFARRVQQETNGWASEDELVAQLVKQNARTPEPLLRTYAHPDAEDTAGFMTILNRFLKRS